MIFLYYLITIRVHFILKPSENKELKKVSHQSANPLTKKNIGIKTFNQKMSFWTRDQQRQAYLPYIYIFEELADGLGLQ
jgi:hypothetical protein